MALWKRMTASGLLTALIAGFFIFFWAVDNFSHGAKICEAMHAKYDWASGECIQVIRWSVK